MTHDCTTYSNIVILLPCASPNSFPTLEAVFEWAGDKCHVRDFATAADCQALSECSALALSPGRTLVSAPH